MLRVFGDIKSGNCFKIKLLLHQLGRDYEWVHVDVMRKESRTPAFLRMNPKGQIPVLQIEPNNFLTESNAILHYLAAGSDLLPRDRLEHARVLEWMFFEQYDHEPTIASARFIVLYLGRPPEHEQSLQQKLAGGYEALELMEQHLRTHEYFAGGKYTIADIALYAYTHVAHEGGFDLSRFPAVQGWLSRIRQQPGYVGMDAP